MVRLLTTSALLVAWLSCGLASEAIHFNPDTDPSRMDWSDLRGRLGPAPDVRGQRFGIVLKNHINDYWRLMAEGYRKRAAADGVKVDIQAAQNESDPIRQLAIMENMVGGLYTALLISPQSSSNLQPAIDDAMAAKVPLVDVDGAVVDDITHFVGSMNRDMGARVARWFIQRHPVGGKVAVVEGQAGIFSTVQRTAGFVETLQDAKMFKVAAIVSGQWDRQQSYDRTIDILDHAPDLLGIYCNNDVMALGAVDAVKARHLLGQVRVFGTDGTRDAYRSISAGEMTGTVDIFPAFTGAIGLEVAERLSVGQVLPRVVTTPQALVTRENMWRYDGNGDAARKALLEDAQHRRP